MCNRSASIGMIRVLIYIVDGENDDEEGEDCDDDAFRRTQPTLDSPENTFSKRMLPIEIEELVNLFLFSSAAQRRRAIPSMNRSNSSVQYSPVCFADGCLRERINIHNAFIDLASSTKRFASENRLNPVNNRRHRSHFNQPLHSLVSIDR